MKPFIDNKVHAVKGRVNHIYLLNGEHIIVVDPEFPSSVGEVLDYIRQSLHRSIRDIRLICATHAHPDHIGGLDRIVSITHSDVALPMGSRPFIEGKATYKVSPVELGRLFWLLISRWHWPAWSDLLSADIVGFPPIPNRFQTVVSGWLSDGEQLPFGSRWRVLETPGHSRDSICLYNREEEALISGDLILNLNGQPCLNPIILEDRDRALQSLERLRRLRVTHLCPGYGPPLSIPSILSQLRQ